MIESLKMPENNDYLKGFLSRVCAALFALLTGFGNSGIKGVLLCMSSHKKRIINESNQLF